MQTTSDIRDLFIGYFRNHGHEALPSGPLVPRNDPTLMFTNAGMVQFKNVFTGVETRDCKRAVTSQKCVRAGGKHNDLENVGYTARHHTFFEMLGNFSFGDYFKDVAIELAWDLITKEMGLDKGKLLATVYADDDEAFDLWKKIAGLPEEKIIRIATSDNFWSMGDTGPCGPCSEIFYDHGEHLPGGPPGSPDEDGDRFIEIWNLVFMQYEQVAPGQRIDLPKPSVDTGMGLERIAAVLQGTHDNYDIDLMRGLILASAEATGTPPDGEGGVSHRVIADHLRACGFLIADGVLPSNEGRGNVLRRIMRRAMRHAHMLGAREPLMYRLVPALIRAMGQAYPELVRAEALITATLELEESQFKKTLARGLKLLEDETVQLDSGAALAGDVAFKLYDTYGFPLDLTQDILRGQGRTVDIAGFDAAMAKQREAARKTWAGSGEAVEDRVWFELRDKVGATEFLGYETDMAEGRIEALVVDGKPVDHADAGVELSVIVNQTPFYAESGGQIGDTGILFGAAGFEVAVTDTVKRAADLHVHMGKVTSGTISVGDFAELRVNSERRDRLRANHSVTHLAHEALRRRLGGHVTQKGSQVAPDRMRFDFSHPKALSADDISAIEADVNARVRANREVVTRLMAPEQAVEAGALALFGEKYGDEVRVVSMGDDTEKPFYSTELCGGTHVRRTGDIGLFKIVGESAVAAGVRRIEVLTGRAAEDQITAERHVLDRAAALLKVARTDLPGRIEALVAERKKLERDLAQARRNTAGGGGGDAGPQVLEVAGIKFAARDLPDLPPRELKPMADELKKKIGSGVVAVASATDGKASLVVAVTDDLTDRLSAVDFVRAGAEALGGKGGGGRPDMAQAGGPDASATSAAINAVKRALAKAAQGQAA